MSMVTFDSYIPEHLDQLQLQDPQAWLASGIDGRTYARALEAGGLTTSGFDEAGNLLGCAGFLPQGGCRAVAWALLSKHVRPRHFVAIDRKVRAHLAEALTRWDRIEAYVDPSFAQSVKWAASLGFTLERNLECYWPGRRPALLCSKISPPEPEVLAA